VGERARKIAKMLWPEKDWVKNVDLLELMGDGEFIINGNPFSKIPINNIPILFIFN